eukprot:scaffold50866_cov35-Prasinocladus_malaysianus.AAC.1
MGLAASIQIVRPKSRLKRVWPSIARPRSSRQLAVYDQSDEPAEQRTSAILPSIISIKATNARQPWRSRQWKIFSAVLPSIQRVAQRGHYHLNTAARQDSDISVHLDIPDNASVGVRETGRWEIVIAANRCSKQSYDLQSVAIEGRSDGLEIQPDLRSITLIPGESVT